MASAKRERDRVRASSPRPHLQTGPATFKSSARREKKDGDKRVNCVSDCPVTVSVRLKALVWLVVVVPVVVVTVTGQTTPNPVQEKEGRKKGKKRD